MRILTIPMWNTNTFIHRGYQLAKNLVKLGDEVHFIIWDRNPVDINSIKQNLSSSFKYIVYVKDGVIIHKVRRLPFIFPPINSFLFKRLVSQICNREGIDVIISASFINEVEPPFDLPLVYDVWDHQEAWQAIYSGRIERFFSKYILRLKESVHNQIEHAAAATAVSDILVDYVKGINPAIPVFKVHNGFDSVFLETPLEVKSDKPDKYSMVYVGHFTEFDNLPKLIKTIGLLKMHYPTVKLVLVGDGPAIEGARNLVERTGLLESVFFLGRVPHEKVPDIINKCEIGLSLLKEDLYTNSAFPLSIMEYTALGKRVVSSSLKEVKSLNFPNIFFYDDKGGIEELANGIVTAFNTNLDQHEIRELVRNYTWSDIAQQFRSIIQMVAN